MEPSRRTLSATLVVFFLLVATEIAPIQAFRCTRLSARFKGACFSDRHCNRVCLDEGNGNYGGFCGTNELKCYCRYDCNARAQAATAAVDSDDAEGPSGVARS